MEITLLQTVEAVQEVLTHILQEITMVVGVVMQVPPVLLAAAAAAARLLLLPLMVTLLLWQLVLAAVAEAPIVQDVILMAIAVPHGTELSSMAVMALPVQVVARMTAAAAAAAVVVITVPQVEAHTLKLVSVLVMEVTAVPIMVI